MGAVLGHAAPASAQTRAQFRLDHWTTEQGLPSHTVHDIAQTSDGYLWIATTGGLVRFDGRTFTVVGSGALPNNRAFGLDAVGDTIHVTLEGGGVFRVHAGTVSAVDTALVAWDVARGPDGLWLVNERIRHADHAGRVRPIADASALLGPDGTPGARPRLWRDATGSVWIHALGRRGVARLRTTGKLDWLDAGGHLLITDATRGEVLFARRGGPLTRIVNEDGEVRGAFPTGGTSMPRLVDRRGRLWVTRQSTLEAYEGVSGERVARFTLPVAQITVMAEDREGNLWMGTPDLGLYRIREVPFTVLNRGAGFGTSQVFQLSRGDGGAVFASTRPHGFYRVANGLARPLTPPGRPSEIHGAWTDDRGTRWLSLDRPTPAEAFEVVGAQPRGPFVRFWTPLPPTGFASDPTDPTVVWAYASHLVFRARYMRDGGVRLTDTYETPGPIHHLHVDRRGAAWTAGVDSAGAGRLTRIERGVVRAARPVNGLPAVQLRAIHEDRDGTLWVGSYGGGLTRLRNDTARTVTAGDGLHEDVVSTILEDDAGNLWMGGNRSVHRVSRAGLNAFLDGTEDRVPGIGYGRPDGLINPEGSGGHGIRTDDGHLWFPTFDGLAVVDPRHAIALDSSPPVAHVTALHAGEDAVDLRGPGALAAHQRQLQFDFVAVGLRSADRVRAEYRLDGFDDHWTAAGPEGRVTYRGLSPRRYTFRVRAVNAGGIRSAADAAFTFTVAPHVYERGWFALLASVTLALLAFGAFQIRVRALMQREAALALRVEERTRELAAETKRAEEALGVVLHQREKLRELDRAKSRLVANVSHEFRTPLSLVIGPMEDVRDGRSGPITDEARTRLDRGLANARRLVALVDQLLDAAMLEAGTLRLHLQAADLVGLLRRLTESFSSMAERQGIRFRITTPVGGLPVRFDPDQLDKVFTNLLGNAFKFTEAGGEVTLEAWRDGDGESAAAVVAVRDTGVGIPAEHLSRVFERFYQVDDSQSRAYEGSGLGLAITRELVELHGGTIAVDSQPGRGTTFTVRLPVSASEIAADAIPRAAGPAGGSLATEATTPGKATPDADAPDDPRTTVLLVEDNTELRAYLRDILGHDYRVVEAGRGDEALRLARAAPPDCIVSDIMMPGMDGQSLCEAVKADAEIGFVPVILLTAKASLDSRISGLRGGADDYLTKPVDRRELLARIGNIIQSRQRLRERYAASHHDLPQVAVAWRTLEPTTDAVSRDWLKRLSDVIAAELANEDLDADRLAAQLSMSRSTLYRQCERLLGRGPMAVVWDRRLDQAALWLAQSEANVSEVAYAVGFKSVPHFSTRFRARFGESPSAYRNRQRPAPVQA